MKGEYLSSWRIDQLSERCASETLHFYRGQPNDDSYCHELFRRGILDSNVEARLAIRVVYAAQIRKWISDHAPDLDPVDQDFLADEELDRFWRSFGARQFNTSRGLRQILEYWRLCVSREAQRANAKASKFLPLNDEVVGVVQHVAMPDRVWEIVASHCDRVDTLLARKLLVEAMKPAEIFAQMREQFTDVQQVYERLRNLKDRLKRDQQLRALWEEN